MSSDLNAMVGNARHMEASPGRKSAVKDAFAKYYFQEVKPMKKHGVYEKVGLNGIVPGRLIRHTRASSAVISSHWHPELEINTAFEGASRFFINGRIEDVTPDNIVLINSREIHSSIPFFPKGGICVTGVTIQISYDFLKKVIPDYDKCYFKLTETAGQKISQLLEEMNKQCENQDVLYIDIQAIRQICDIVYILATECCTKREIFKETGAESLQRFEQVLEYVHENYSSVLRTSEVAERFFFSKEYFCRLFKKNTGVTFNQYVMECRVMHAEKMLRETNARISEIAQEVGYSDEASFITQFKKYYSETPGNYRKKTEKNPFYENE